MSKGFSSLCHNSTCFSVFSCYNKHIIRGEVCTIREQIRSLTANITRKTVTLRLFEAIVGYLFSNAVFARGIMPLGTAFSAAGSFWGFLGAFAGHLLLGRDVLRTLTACFMTRVFRWTLTSLTEENKPAACLLFTLWGTMLGGLTGFFFSDYTPAENVAFMVNGLLAGGMAWVFSTAFSAFSSRPVGNISLRYVCCLLSLSALLVGVMGQGGLWETAGRTALYFIVLCVGRKCSFFYTFSTAAGVGLILCLFSTARLSLFLILFFGTLLSAAFGVFGRYGQILSYLLAAFLLWLTAGRSFGVVSTLISIALAGLLFLTVPGKMMTALTRSTVPAGGGYSRWRRAKFHLTKQGTSDRTRGGIPVCRTCPKRILCNTKFRTETAEAFDLIREGIRTRDLRPPREFLDRCLKFPHVIAALRRDEETVYRLTYAKAFAQKDGEIFCGDTAGGYKTADDRYVFTVTDGMGSGTKAARQSVRAVRMMEHLSHNGLEQEDILKVLNRNLLDSPEETVLGVDVATVDLKNGICQLFKAGAAPTYILRNGIAHEIGSETLPVGMLEEADVKRETCTLADRDFLILISDGVLGKDKKWLCEYLNRIPTPYDCVSLADGILREAKKAGRNRIDDVTVLAVQIRKTA